MNVLAFARYTNYLDSGGHHPQNLSILRGPDKHRNDKGARALARRQQICALRATPITGLLRYTRNDKRARFFFIASERSDARQSSK